MTWLTWRQFRAQAATAIGALAAFAILLAATGPHLASVYAASRIAGCHGGGCGQLASNFLVELGTGYPFVYLLGLAGVIVAPAAIGIFWGAPLVARELETGTLALAWTQSITRARWLAVKLALIGLAAMAVTEALSLMLGWWAAPIGRAAWLLSGSNSPFGWGQFSVAFDARGITPLGYAAFAFALGVTIGLLIRRTVPAMAVTLAIFVAVQIAFPQAIRPHLFPPSHASVAIGPGADGVGVHLRATAGSRSPTAVTFTVQRLSGQPGAWILSSTGVNAAGQPVSAIPAACTQPGVSFSPGFPACLASHGMRIAVTYQPASRYWAIQWTETAIYIVLALALAGYCFWRIGRRLS
jgi:ABC-2 family transporter protein